MLRIAASAGELLLRATAPVMSGHAQGRVLRETAHRPWPIPSDPWLIYRLPYFKADMKVRVRGEPIDYRSRRVSSDGRPESTLLVVNAHGAAQLTHERAAALHEKVAVFWDRHGKPEKARVEREWAMAERFGAELEERRLRGQRDRSRAGERAGELGEDGEVGVKLHSIYPPDPKRW